LVRGTGEQVIAGSNCTTFWRVVRPGVGGMNVAGIARARACFENAIEVPTVIVAEGRHKALHGSSGGALPHMPQVPQPHAPARRAMADEEDAF
jgi:hypothetical protein